MILFFVTIASMSNHTQIRIRKTTKQRLDMLRTRIAEDRNAYGHKDGKPRSLADDLGINPKSFETLLSDLVDSLEYNIDQRQAARQSLVGLTPAEIMLRVQGTHRRARMYREWAEACDQFGEHMVEQLLTVGLVSLKDREE